MASLEPQHQHQHQQRSDAPINADDAIHDASARDALGQLRVHLVSHADLRLQSPDNDNAAIYATVSLDPGNQCVSSSVLTIASRTTSGDWSDQVSLQLAAAADSDCDLLHQLELVIEVWERCADATHALIGSARVALPAILTHHPTESAQLALARKSGRGYAGSITLQAALELDRSFESLGASPSLPDPSATRLDDLESSAKGTLLIAVLACRGLDEVRLQALSRHWYNACVHQRQPC